MFLVIHKRVAELKHVRKVTFGVYLHVLFRDNLKDSQFFLNIHHPLYAFFSSYNLIFDQINITVDESRPQERSVIRPYHRYF